MPETHLQAVLKQSWKTVTHRRACRSKSGFCAPQSAVSPTQLVGKLAMRSRACRLWLAAVPDNVGPASLHVLRPDDPAAQQLSNSLQCSSRCEVCSPEPLRHAILLLLLSLTRRQLRVLNVLPAEEGAGLTSSSRSNSVRQLLPDSDTPARALRCSCRPHLI